MHSHPDFTDTPGHCQYSMVSNQCDPCQAKGFQSTTFSAVRFQMKYIFQQTSSSATLPTPCSLGVVVSSFVLVALAFIIYDWLVNRNQSSPKALLALTSLFRLCFPNEIKRRCGTTRMSKGQQRVFTVSAPNTRGGEYATWRNGTRSIRVQYSFRGSGFTSTCHEAQAM
jgi:hypothetical protein